MVLLSISKSLATKGISWNNEPCMARPILIDLNLIALKYYSAKISLGKYRRRCNISSPKVCVLKKTEGINVKVFNMITNKNEAKTINKHISCDCKCKFNSTTCNSS